MVRSCLTFLSSSAHLLFALLLLLAYLPQAKAACSMGQDHGAVLQQRIDSADRLIAEGTQIEERTGSLIDKFNQLRGASGRSLADNQSIDVFALYESLFKQYEDALAQYKQHRREYVAHVQQFHQAQQPEAIVGSSTQDPNVGNASDFANTAGVLKFKVQDKCTALQQLEGRIITNESRLEEMVSDLESSMQKESRALFAASWTAANQLAIQNSTLAGQYNHLGLQKTAWYSRNVHDFIAEANRDGAYGAHVQAYKDLSNGNAMESEIFKRCQAHLQRATSTLSELAAIRPAGLSLAAPQAGAAPVTADEIKRESNTLDSEYANVQELFAKLESVRKSMPPSLKKNKGITN